MPPGGVPLPKTCAQCEQKHCHHNEIPKTTSPLALPEPMALGSVPNISNFFSFVHNISLRFVIYSAQTHTNEYG